MDREYQQKLALSVNRNDLLESFSKALKLAIHNYWEGKLISAALLAKEFNKHCEQSDEVNREQVRRWVRGDAFPDPMHFAILHQWLSIDVNMIFKTVPAVERFMTSVDKGDWKLKKRIPESELLEIVKNIEEYQSDEEIVAMIQSLKAILMKRL